MAAPVSATLRAYELRAMVRTCALALDAFDGSDVSDGVACVRNALEVAERLANELADVVEALDRLAKVGPLRGPRDAA